MINEEDVSKIEMSELEEIEENMNAFERSTQKIEEDDSWEEQFKEESFQSVLQQEEIYPQLKPRKNAVYEAKLLTLPKKITTKHGTAYVIDLEYQGMRYSMYTPKSFLFNLAVQKRRNNLESEDLIGKKIAFQKTPQKTEHGTANMYTVQIKE
jgi:hypothetical protein